MNFLIVLTAFLSFSVIVSCGNEEDETTQSSVKISMTTTGQSSPSLAFAAEASDFRNTSIASGAPDSMTLYIKKMSLLAEADGAPATIFYEESGKPIKVSAGKVDISQLFTIYECLNSSGEPVEDVGECPCGLDESNVPVEANSDGTCPAEEGSDAVGVTSVVDGTYKFLEIEFLQKGTVNGCVTGNFSDNNDSNGVETQGEHTYCTQESLHTFQDTPGGAAASEFENVSAENMIFQISLGNELLSDETATQSFQYPLTEEITVSADSTPTMTMVIDTNRMLRFYNQNITQSINPGVVEDRSFFFNTVFDYSTFAFVGTPGDIRGFQWWTEACSGTVTSDRICTSDFNTVAGWATIVKDGDGNPIVVGFMPDDDNSWTIIKGSNKSADGIDTSAFTASGSNHDVGFTLGSDGEGTIYGLNLDAELGTTQDLTFEGLQSSYGRIYFNRQL